MSLSEEIWKDIPGFEGLYAVSSSGKILSKGKKLIKVSKNRYGYFKFCLRREGKTYYLRVHRAVALAFLDNPKNYEEVNHKNWIKTDNRVENLEWCSKTQNRRHSSKLKNNIEYIKKELVNYKLGDYARIARKYCVDTNTIRDVHVGKSWT